MYSIDKSGFKNYLNNFYKQIQESNDLYVKANISLKSENIQNILYLGMGGSAIAGDILNDVLFDSLNIPLRVTRGYYAPKFCDSNTLVIAASYSGNTEETLMAIDSIADSGAQFVVITSGGTLKERAKEKNWGIIEIPEGYPPRQALGYIFFPLYHMLGNLGLLNDYDPDLSQLIKFTKEMSKRNDYTMTDSHILSRELAQTIHKKIPIIYSTAPYLSSISRRWQNQMQENGKSLAFSNVLPEFNHNEIVGWELEQPCVKDFIVIFVENENPLPRIKQRIELSKKIIKDRGVEVVDIYSAGETNLEKVFSLIILGDWVSYYLALAYKKSPQDIKNIDYLKSQLAKFEN
ncbi:MAG: bifunctional phosphoglucose/phosphomannose isomerase [Calditrichaceae bacterium]